ncbi:hypothetical protein [Cytobacillus purgationiresistens]|uniref:Uncharacterized protein n=1 Tax=Cytobacillus purgationiresistens TaxID=863449 RepID=A0ABU0AEC8_9BACI|nr:hypothetical protein [Cytobacillus purgationiresistens]MDQ0269152.1 hypothetical protein [Cytobacillus purgationiresistens]
MNRKSTQRKKKPIKLVAGLLFCVLMVSSSVSIAFANNDIESMLTTWFASKKADSIASIEKAVATEQEKQTIRLKEEVRVKIAEADKQIQQTTQTEIDLKVQELKRYTDELINSYHPAQEGNEEVIKELNGIMEAAKQQMEAVSKPKQAE